MGARTARSLLVLALGTLGCAASLCAAPDPAPGAGDARGDARDMATRPAIVFGFTPDARPLSYSEVIQGNKTGQVLGFCRLLHDHLTGLGHRVEPQELPFDERFVHFGQALGGRPAIQCGPSSRTPARLAALAPGQTPGQTPGFRAEVTRPFLVTSSRLLIRRERVPTLYDHPEDLRIGILKPRAGLEPVTTEIVQSVFANARFIGLSNRTEAVQGLTRAAEAPDAIDAYASDDVILRDILAHDMPDRQRADYVVEPPLGGFSREEYVLVVFNAAELAVEVTQWLDSPAGRRATDALLPPADPVLAGLNWFARSDHLSMARLTLLAALALLCTALGWLGWRRWRHHRNAAPEASGHPDLPPGAANGTAASEPRPAVGVQRAPADRALTPREREILAMLAQGCSNKEAAKALGLSYRTVEAHRKNIYTKLGIKTTAGLVEYALSNRPDVPRTGHEGADSP